MKSFIVIAVLAALTVSSLAASIPTEVAREEPHGVEHRLGNFRVGDVQLVRTEASIDAIPNIVQSKVVEYRGDANTRVTRISILEPGLPQGGYPLVTGFGTNQVMVTLTSGFGKGFYYVIEMWGRSTE